MTKIDKNGCEKAIYTGKLSKVAQIRKFHDLIKAYADEYETTQEFAMFRMYDECKQQVKQETFH